MVATSALLLALMYGLVWVMDRKSRAALAFAFEAFAIVLSVVVELGMMYSTTPEEWGEWVRWTQIPIFIRTAGLLAFIWYYFETGRPWLIWTIIVSRLVVLVVGFVIDPNFNYSRIDSLEPITFLGETVSSVGSAELNRFQWFATASTFLVLVFVVDASISLWRKGTSEARRKAVVIGGATFLSWALGNTYTQLMIWTHLAVPVLLSPPYLLMLAAMTFELSRDTLRASRLARELKESQTQLDVVAASAGVGLWTWDARSDRLWLTQRAREMFDLAPDDHEIVDADLLRAMISPDDLARIRKVWSHAVATGAEEEVTFRIDPPGKEPRWILAHGRAAADAAGNVSVVQGVLRDVTEQWRARQENEELRRELAHAGRVSVLGTLSSSLAHELSQPLGAIMLNAEAAELLLAKPNPDLQELRNIITDIQRDDRRAAEVIDGLRRLLKRRELEFSPVAIEALVRDVVALLKSDAIARNVLLEFNFDPELPVIRGDKVHLSQVLINLVINGMDAVSALPAAQRRVTLSARAGGNESVELSVEDSGPGIPNEVRGRIFEPFFTTKAQGMGMGLSVSQTIVSAHGGRIWADQAATGGAVFRVSLPAAAA